jgi:ATP-dependent Clp protease ATP-binding subunit ClpX
MASTDVLSCTFCLRTSAEVERLLGGPSASICDGCVGEWDRILADPSIPFPGLEGEDDETLLRRLPPAAGRVAAADAGLRGLVDLLRSREVSWARIGDALSVSRQAAWERFG